VGKKQIFIAKITRPDVSGIVTRKRLFRLLDNYKNKPITWVSAPAGSGKTTLIASYLETRKIPCLWYRCDAGDSDIATFFYYMGLAAKKASPRRKKPMPLLTPEYLLGIPTFTKRYFEELYERISECGLRRACRQAGNAGLTHPFTPLKRGIPKSKIQNPKSFTIVLDNYQEVRPDSQFHEVIRNGLAVIPAGIKVVLISRTEPPGIMAPLRAGNKMQILQWEDIKLTLDEAKGIMKFHSKAKLTKEMCEIIHKKTDGWAAGLVLMAESTKIKNADYKIRDTQTPYEIFDYFASEIFEKTDKDIQDFLLKTAFLPTINVRLAKRLTALEHAGSILSFFRKGKERSIHGSRCCLPA
jgi:ATP/maltotriose-dependent transcriptional regulator MalT